LTSQVFTIPDEEQPACFILFTFRENQVLEKRNLLRTRLYLQRRERVRALCQFNYQKLHFFEKKIR